MIGPEILCHTEKIAPGTATTGFTAALAAKDIPKVAARPEFCIPISIAKVFFCFNLKPHTFANTKPSA